MLRENGIETVFQPHKNSAQLLKPIKYTISIKHRGGAKHLFTCNSSHNETQRYTESCIIIFVIIIIFIIILL